MAQKKITDLQLRSNFDTTCNLPADDASQTWRVTGQQILDFITAQAVDGANLSAASVVRSKLAAGAVAALSVVAKTGTYTASATADDVILVSAASGWTLSLPAASGCTGKVFYIKRTDNAPSNLVTIDPNSSETIDGATTLVLTNQYEYVVIVCDGSNWKVLAKYLQLNSVVHVDSGNGYGSTNTKIRRFTNIRTNTGTAITYADSSSAGASFTINEDGIYQIEYTEAFTSNDNFGLSKNATALTTNLGAIGFAGGFIAGAQTMVANSVNGLSATLSLAAGDVIRAHTNGTAASSGTELVYFRMTQLSRKK